MHLSRAFAKESLMFLENEILFVRDRTPCWITLTTNGCLFECKFDYTSVPPYQPLRTQNLVFSCEKTTAISLSGVIWESMSLARVVAGMTVFTH